MVPRFIPAIFAVFVISLTMSHTYIFMAFAFAISSLSSILTTESERK